MKRVIYLYIIACILLFMSCKQPISNCPEITNPIDWDGYNNVKTINENFCGDCNDFHFPTFSGKTIKVCGWIYVPIEGYGTFSYAQFDVSDEIFSDTPPGAGDQLITINGYRIIEDLMRKFDTCDLKQKCYITGELSLHQLSLNYYCVVNAGIILHNIDDIYFEGERSKQ